MDKLKKIADKYNMDISECDPIQLIKGMRVEKEHDTDDQLDVVKNVGDLMKIAMAHLREFPDYYTRLAKMEEVRLLVRRELKQEGFKDVIISAKSKIKLKKLNIMAKKNGFKLMDNSELEKYAKKEKWPSIIGYIRPNEKHKYMVVYDKGNSNLWVNYVSPYSYWPDGWDEIDRWNKGNSPMWETHFDNVN